VFQLLLWRFLRNFHKFCINGNRNNDFVSSVGQLSAKLKKLLAIFEKKKLLEIFDIRIFQDMHVTYSIVFCAFLA